jgi:hypothetical protein
MTKTLGGSGSLPAEETVFLTDEIIPKQRARHPVANNTGWRKCSSFSI